MLSSLQSNTSNETAQLHIGIDVGSTTTKLVAIDTQTNEVVHRSYRRHNALQVESVQAALEEAMKRFPTSNISIAFCGSGGKAIASFLDVPYIQEVVANALAIKTSYPATRCAIELGGQDAKMIFFAESNGELTVTDMRMNGSCAGGTGAFLDEIATLLKVPSEKLNDLAEKGTTLYDISGRCGVYAKTDIQPLLNRGVSKEDIALSTFHAVAKQTIGGLAQGLDISAPIIFEGGPFTFNPALIKVFSERLELGDNDCIIPEKAETVVAYGTALSLSSYFESAPVFNHKDSLFKKLELCHRIPSETSSQKPFFTSRGEYDDFYARHPKQAFPSNHFSQAPDSSPSVLEVYLGIDSGSTTTKFALIDKQGSLVDSFYSSNEGEPLDIIKKALIDLNDTYQKQHITLKVLGLGTTGYGELLFARALNADYHTVETVAHAKATTHFIPNASFILDIGGQDMKAIWLEDGIITDIVVNEACSSGCGSFLESFAATLDISTDEIATAAFRSDSPANLGSRCTVFMNSNIVTEQRNGKTPDDIMAGLCRSIVENVFTKVIRVSNVASLGENIVVQGGTFRNDAVLRALEQYLDKNVHRAPYPGIMGALGVAFLTKEHAEATPGFTSSFIGFKAMESFSYSSQANLVCPFCTNQCNRTLITFSNGESFVTGNRCLKGEIVGNLTDEATRQKFKEQQKNTRLAPNLFDLRARLLFKDYPLNNPLPTHNITIGIPRVLMFWETMPFWTTLFRQLGFNVVLSAKSSQKLYESGLSAITSDTICFPAKLVHGHIRDLMAKQVDRIFMPIITTVPSENTQRTSQSMCAVVKGYPIVIRNSDNPERKWNGHFDDPLFHWYSEKDLETQLCGYLKDTFGIQEDATKKAINLANAAMHAFHRELTQAGQQVLDDVAKENRYAIVLASRPYHNDDLINHDLPTFFTEIGIPVLPPDAVPGITAVDLSKSRLEIVNNFHARMLSSAILSAQSDHMEYVQLVSFGCGHDAYLSDEIIRLTKEISDKSPLVLKIDESENQGPLRIRIRSFIETIDEKRKTHTTLKTHPLAEPYKIKYTDADHHQRTILVPNTSHAFCRLMSAAMSKQGTKAEPLDVGREEAIRLGKKYVHNDICFPAQITVGEALAALESGRYNPDKVAVGTGKYIGDCRLTHYAPLLRKALDDAGYPQVPIITNDDQDNRNIHPGFRIGLASSIRIAMCLPMIDVLEDLLRKIRPYELVRGASQRAFDKSLDEVLDGMVKHGIKGAERGFKRAMKTMKEISYDRSKPKPTVLIVGEYLLNFHPGANHDIEQYLEDNGMEVIQARMTDVIRKTYFYKDAQVKEYNVDLPLQEKLWYSIANRLFVHAHKITDRIAQRHPLAGKVSPIDQLVETSDSIIHHTFDAGEGVLIPGEILHHAKQGCRSFVILQPFGCLPNHIVGRGISKKLKELFPDANILSLDYDPDVSFANIENRLQMLIMNSKEQLKYQGGTYGSALA